jgi:hypothetical protein
MAFLVARYLGMKSYGSIYGTLYGFFALGAGIGPTVYGAVFDRTRSYSGVLSGSSVLFIAGGLLLLALGRYRQFPAAAAARADLAPRPAEPAPSR